MFPFEYVAVYYPGKDETAGNKPRIVAGPMCVLALDADSARVKAGKEIAAEYHDGQGDMRVFVRPFVNQVPLGMRVQP